MKMFGDMSAARLQEIVERFSSLRIAVLGDYFLDKYLDVDPSLAEVSLETGKTAHQVTAIRHSPGAAGTVMCNLAALEAGTLYAVGYTGDDGESYDLRNDLSALGCNTDYLHLATDRMTPTYLKPCDVDKPGLAGEHSRYDTKNRERTPDVLQQKVIDSLDTLLPKVDAVITMDQVEEEDCGVVTRAVRGALAARASAARDTVFWADSRRRIRDFRQVIIKPNQFEAVECDNPAPNDSVDLDCLAAAMAHLCATTGAPIVATRGPEGIVVSDPEFTLVPGVCVGGPLDTTGAGDSTTAGCVLALAAGASLPEAALVGNLVASITVQQLATTGTASPAQLLQRLDMWHAQHKHC